MFDFDFGPLGVLVLSSRRPRSALELSEFICIYISCHEMRYISLQKN